MLRAVFFDLDNTLIDRDAAHAAWCRRLIEGSTASAETPLLVAEMMRRDEGGYGDRAGYFDWIASLLGDDFDGNALFLKHQETIADFILPVPEARSVLEEFRRKVLVAIVTNGDGATQRAKLRVARLDDVVDAIFVSGEVGYHKPDPRIFGHAFAALGLQPTDVLFVGDDPVRDVLGARRVGMSTCWVQRTNAFPPGADPPDFLVHSVADLVQLMREGSLC